MRNLHNAGTTLGCAEFLLAFEARFSVLTEDPNHRGQRWKSESTAASKRSRSRADETNSTGRGLAKLVKQRDRQAIIETLYGSRVLIQRQEVAEVEDDDEERDYSYPRVEFFGRYGRWPLDRELKQFEKTLDIKPLVKGELTE